MKLPSEANGDGGKPKPSELPGMTGPGVAPVKIEAVDKLVDIYVRARNARMDRTKIEVDAKAALIAVLHENEKLIGVKDGVLTYKHDDLIVTLKSGKEELKVRTQGDEDNE